MRAKLRDDFYVAPGARGTYILTGKGAIIREDPEVFAWIQRIAPALDGSRTIGEVVSAFDPAHRAMAERVATLLRECEAIDDQRVEAECSAPSAPRYASEIGFIGCLRGAPARVFERYRDTGCLVMGSGELLLASVRSCLRSGLSLVRAVSTTPQASELRALRPRDPRQRVEPHVIDAEDAGRERLRALMAGVGIVLRCADAPWDSRVIEEECARSNAIHGQARRADDGAWIAHVVEAGDGPLWEDLRHRSAAFPERGGHGGQDGDLGATLGVTAAVVAGTLVHAVLRHLTAGVGRAPAWTRRIHADTLETTDHVCPPHPFTRPAEPPDRARFEMTVRQLEAGRRLSLEELAERASGCTDPRFGLFGEITDGDFTQGPMWVAEVAVSNPAGLRGDSAEAITVRGAGPDAPTAQADATLRAFAMYGALMVDPRRLVDPDTGGCAESPAADGTGPAQEARYGGVFPSRTWGWSLRDRRPRLVDALDAFPLLRAAPDTVEPPVGACAGLSWSEAVDAALLAHCMAAALSRLSSGAEPFRRVDPADVALDAAGARCLKILLAAIGPLSAYDLSRLTGVPTFAVCPGTSTAAIVSGTSPERALGDALRQALLRHQAEVYREPGYAPPYVPHIPAELRGDAGKQIPSDRRLHQADLVRALSDLGFDPVVVPLDHDPALTRAMPYAVQVVLADA